MIEINYHLSGVINEILPERKDVFPSLQFSNIYTIEELQQVKELELNNFNSLEDINKLPNLKNLSIKSADYNKFATYIDLDANTLINHITNFEVLENLVNLEKLEIINDINIEKLDLKKLINLKSLKLINNPNMEYLNNLDKLTKLEEVVIYGTNIKSNLNFEKYFLNTYNAKTNILDINMYHNIVEGDIKNAQKMAALSRLGYNKITFAEKTGFFDKYTLNAVEMFAIYQYILEIFKKNQIYKLEDYDQIKFVYNYVVNNVKYDEYSIKQRDKKYLEAIKNEKLSKYNHNEFTKLHSSYNALMLGKSNCEGYVNLMRFMFQLLDIKSQNVYCTKKGDDKIAFYNHSIIKIKYNNKWYYCEPTWENVNEYQYFMMDYVDVIKTHVLNPLELKSNKEVVRDGNNFKHNR